MAKGFTLETNASFELGKTSNGKFVKVGDLRITTTEETVDGGSSQTGDYMNLWGWMLAAAASAFALGMAGLVFSSKK